MSIIRLIFLILSAHSCYPQTSNLLKAITVKMAGEPPSYSVNIFSRPSTVLPANLPSTSTHPLPGIFPPSTRTQVSTYPSPVPCAQKPSPRNEVALAISPSATRKKALKLHNARAATSATSVTRVSPQSAAWHSTAEELMPQKNQPRWLPKSQSEERDTGQKKSTNSF